MTRPAARKFILLEFVFVLVGLATVTAIFRLTNLDLAAARLFLEPCCSWPLAELPFWHFVYVWGVFGGLLLGAAALVALTLSYWYPPRLYAWRRPALYLVLVLALGPGLVVNGLFKDHYGRPRPREVVELGGHEAFLKVLTPGTDPQAKSFPCGHCAMGFYLATPFLILRRRRPKLAAFFLGAGVLSGLVLGASRMMAGGHFFSDVLFSGGLVWLVALAVYYAMDLEREMLLAPSTPERDRVRARIATLFGTACLTLLTVGVLLATPYVSRKSFSLSASGLEALRSPVFEVSLDEADVAFRTGDHLEASYDIHAFGFPTSRVAFRLEEGAEKASLYIEPMGWFTERRTTVDLTIPQGLEKPFRLSLRKGQVDLDLHGLSRTARLEVSVAEGVVHLRGGESLDPDHVSVRVGRGKVLRD